MAQQPLGESMIRDAMRAGGGANAKPRGVSRRVRNPHLTPRVDRSNFRSLVNRDREHAKKSARVDLWIARIRFARFHEPA